MVVAQSNYSTRSLSLPFASWTLLCARDLLDLFPHSQLGAAELRRKHKCWPDWGSSRAGRRLIGNHVGGWTAQGQRVDFTWSWHWSGSLQHFNQQPATDLHCVGGTRRENFSSRLLPLELFCFWFCLKKKSMQMLRLGRREALLESPLEQVSFWLLVACVWSL